MRVLYASTQKSDRRNAGGLTTAQHTRARLSRFAAVFTGLAVIAFALGVSVKGTESLALLFISMFCLTAGTSSLALTRMGRTIAAARIQVVLILAIGAALIPAHPHGLLAMISFVIIAAVHALVFHETTRVRAQKIAFEVLSLSAGALIAGMLLTQFWSNMTAAGVVMGAAIAYLLIFEWRTVSRFMQIDQSLPARRFGDLQNAIARMGTGIVQFSSQGRLLSASDPVCEILDCEKYELAGEGWLKRVHVADRPAFLKLISDAAHGESDRTAEFRVLRDAAKPQNKHPRYAWVEMSATRTSGIAPSGKSEVIAAVRDISVRKKRQAQMEEAKRHAEQAAMAKTRFLATIGHELRTPLNAIVGFSEMMSSGIGGELSGAHAEYADHIETSGRHLLGVVNMLLDMSKIEAGKFELQLDKVKPEKLVAPTLQMLDRQMADRDIRVEVHAEPNLPAMNADERACRQILINLVSNAVKFSPRGETVDISLRRQGTRIAIAVSDKGVGMSPEDVARVGEPFFQAGSGLSRRFEGTGLGLSIVKGLIELHQGQFTITSEVGEGTRVTALLPIDGPSEDEYDDNVVTSIEPDASLKPEISWPEKQSKAS